jgi:hypothetical protein
MIKKEDLLDRLVDQAVRGYPPGFIGIFLELIQDFSRSPYWSAWMRVETLLFWQDMKMFFLQNQTELLTGLISITTVVILFFILAGVYRRQLIFREQVTA